MAEPLDSVHVTLYVVVVCGRTEALPEIALLVEKFVPTHEVAFVELQVSLADFPPDMDIGLAESDALGAAAVTFTAAEAVAVPPGPVQVMP